MDKEKEISNLIDKLEPMLNRLSDLSEQEVSEAGALFVKWMQLTNERYFELEEKLKRTSEKVAALEEKVEEYKIPFDVMELFILEKGLNDEFASFMQDLIQDFHEIQKPKLTLVK